jgi:SAM-dependent methyltransferase
MNLTDKKQPISQIPWFKVWFDSAYYHKLYAHRDEREAAGFIDELIRHLAPGKEATMIDVGCGSGRHCKQIASKGFTVAGFDLAASSIKDAKKNENNDLHFFQHDMRMPFGTDHYDYVFNFFTSFGYFKSFEENNKIIRNMSRSLKCGGTLVLDYLNVSYAENRMVLSEEKEIDGLLYKITRWMDDDFFFKKITLEGDSVINTFEYTEQVAKFSLYEFNNFFLSNNLQLEEIYGDYALGSYDSERSPRLIMVAKKIA